MLNDIIKDLGENFKNGDEEVIKKYIDRVTSDALSISNRKKTDENIELLKSEITNCVKGLYLQRGAEGSQSLSDGGKSTSFSKPLEDMRINIVKSGKRAIFL